MTSKKELEYNLDACASECMGLRSDCEAVGNMMERYKAESEAQIVELHAISAALGTSDGHSSVYHIHRLWEALKTRDEQVQRMITFGATTHDQHVNELRQAKIEVLQKAQQGFVIEDLIKELEAEQCC